MSRSKAEREALSRVRALAQSITESEENANDLVDLLEYLHAETVEVLIAAIGEVTEVCCHIVTENYDWLRAVRSRRSQLQSPSDVAEKSSDIIVQYRDWMRKNYAACLERLLQLLYHESSEVQEFSLCSLLKLVEAEGSAHCSTHNTYAFPNALFHRVVGCLLDNDTDQKHLIDRFQEYLEFADVRFYWLKNIASAVLVKVDNVTRQVRIGSSFVENVYCALEKVQMPTSEIGRFLAGDPPPSDDQEGMELEGAERESGDEGLAEGEEELGPPKSKKKKKKKSEVKALSVRLLHKHRKHFSDAWLAFLRLPLSSTVYKKVLVSLHAAVMPHLLSPQLLIDFLIGAYDAGGVISLLALNGLFILIHEYHLDYPAFYTKLYTLLEPSIFHVKYMQRFFCLMDIFLSSTHLPLYLVAAFAKKIARLALTAPPNGIMVAAVMVINLVKRHPNCRVLLHRKGAEDVKVEYDPFNMTETDPAKCGALESCLWELKTLRSHYSPAVSSLVKRLLDSVREERREEALEKYLDIDHQQMFEDESTEVRSKESVPMNFTEPTGLWTPEELEDFSTMPCT